MKIEDLTLLDKVGIGSFGEVWRATYKGLDVAVKKLYFYMSMFNENHRYLSYAVLLFRKSPTEEQVTLFGS